MSAENEQAVLGACLVGAKGPMRAVIESGLSPDHFLNPLHADIFRAILKVALRKERIDAITVANQLERDKVALDRTYLTRLPDYCPVPSNAPAYVERLLEDRQLLEQRKIAAELLEASDPDEARAAIAELTKPFHREIREQDPTELFKKHLASTSELESFTLPWSRLERFSPGGFHRRNFVSLVGWSGHGKSMVLDQMLAHFAARGYSCCLFTTEMSGVERVARYVAANTGISVSDLIMRRLSETERDRAEALLAEHPVPFRMRDASGWSANRIVGEVVQEGYDVFAVDTVNRLPHQNREELEQAVSALYDAAHLIDGLAIGVFHLNNARREGRQDPEPRLRDIRETGVIEQMSDRVLALHRENEDGELGDEGHLLMLKSRGGTPGRVRVQHTPGRFRFLEVEDRFSS